MSAPPLRPLAAAVVAVLALSALSACSGDDSSAGPALSPLAAEGRSIVESAGCVSCHGQDGDGGVGPGWGGLAGSEVELDDGTTVVADAAYLTRAIAAPDEERVAGYTVAMPANNLTAEEIEAVVAYLQELS
ncbi:MAG: c-type cytochrome [Actinomycetota bacterium]